MFLSFRLLPGWKYNVVGVKEKRAHVWALAVNLKERK